MSPTSPGSNQFDRAYTCDSITSSSRRESLPYHDGTSTRSLLRKESQATTTDYDVNCPRGEIIEEPRQRNGFKSNVNKFWRKKSFRSSRTSSTFDGHFAHGRPGWWKKQMLVDRSLRSMAGFTSVCSIAMLIIIFAHLGDFVNRINPHTTSVGGKDGESCSRMERKNVVCFLYLDFWK